MALPLPSQALNVNPKRSNSNQPVYVKLINRIGEQLRTAGYNKPDLNADLLIKQAKKKTGLQDFGDTSFRDGLDILTAELNDFDLGIKENKSIVESANDLIVKYADKLKNVRNNREYNSIVKEEEYQQLEIQLAEKKTKELKVQIEQKKETIGVLTEQLDMKKNHLSAKKGELDEIMQETAKEETLLTTQSAAFEAKIDARLIIAYKRIRGSVKNGLAIVPIERGASGGSYFTIPPQVQMEIAARQKIITDEYSGRILVDAELAEEEHIKINKMIKGL